MERSLENKLEVVIGPTGLLKTFFFQFPAFTQVFSTIIQLCNLSYERYFELPENSVIFIILSKLLKT